MERTEVFGKAFDHMKKLVGAEEPLSYHNLNDIFQIQYINEPKEEQNCLLKLQPCYTTTEYGKILQQLKYSRSSRIFYEEARKIV